MNRKLSLVIKKKKYIYIYINQSTILSMEIKKKKKKRTIINDLLYYNIYVFATLPPPVKIINKKNDMKQLILCWVMKKV